MGPASDVDSTQTHVLYEVSAPPPAMIATVEANLLDEEQLNTNPDEDDSTLPFELPAPSEQVPRINCTDDFLGTAENRKQAETSQMLFWTVVHVQNEAL